MSLPDEPCTSDCRDCSEERDCILYRQQAQRLADSEPGLYFDIAGSSASRDEALS